MAISRRHEELDLAVGLRHHVLVALALDGQRIELSKELRAELAGALGESTGKVQSVIIYPMLSQPKTEPTCDRRAS
jgi:hypothetical protein